MDRVVPKSLWHKSTTGQIHVPECTATYIMATNHTLPCTRKCVLAVPVPIPVYLWWCGTRLRERIGAAPSILRICPKLLAFAVNICKPTTPEGREAGDLNSRSRYVTLYPKSTHAMPSRRGRRAGWLLQSEERRTDVVWRPDLSGRLQSDEWGGEHSLALAAPSNSTGEAARMWMWIKWRIDVGCMRSMRQAGQPDKSTAASLDESPK
jgi:hypothetical protein